MKKLMICGLALMCLGAGFDESECEQVRQLRTGGQLDEAAELAEQCLQDDDSDVEMMLELSRSLAGLERLEDALQWSGRAVQEAPDHQDALFLQARLSAHDGDFETSQQLLDRLDDEARQQAEVQRFEADLWFWRGEHGEASERYAVYLETVPDDETAWLNTGHVRSHLGEREAAIEAYQRSCELGAQTGCGAAEELEQADKRSWFARLEPSYSLVADRPDGQGLRLVAGVEAMPDIIVEAGGHLVRRGFIDDSTLTDTGMTLEGHYNPGKGLRASAGGSYTFQPDFSPSWSAYLEGGWTTERGLDAGLRGWRLQHEDAGTTVIIPSLTQYIGPWALDGRYFLSVSDDGDLDHTALGRVSYFFGDRTSVMAGAGFGTRPDYLELSPITEVPVVSHYTGMVGGAMQIGDHQKLSALVQYRHESSLGFGASAPSNGDAYRSLDLMLGWEVARW